MSSHVKQRKTFEIIPGSLLEVTIQCHMVEDLSAQDMIAKLFTLGQQLADNHRALIKARDAAVAEDRRVRESAAFDRLHPTTTSEQTYAAPIEAVVQAVAKEVKDVIDEGTQADSGEPSVRPLRKGSRTRGNDQG